MVLITVVIFVGLLLTLVLVHEWGHFITAKKAGCKVEEFGFGFPPRLFSFMYHDTLYSVNLFPIGGFVKIEGENMDDADPSPTSFAGKSPWWRLAILVAGVVMNIVLAVALLSWQSVIGSPTVVTQENAGSLTDIYTYVIDVAPNSPAESAGLQAFDRIDVIGNTSRPELTQVQEAISEHLGSTVTFEVERQGQHFTFEVPARENPPEGEGATGISLAETGLERSPWYLAPVAGVTKTWQMLVAIVLQLQQVVATLVSTGDAGTSLTGPIGIAVYTQEVTRMGLSYFLEFAAMISINLALINILPLPALDGGRILFVFVELLAGKRVPGKYESIAHTVGFVALLGLMLLVTLRDVHRYF